MVARAAVLAGDMGGPGHHVGQILLGVTALGAVIGFGLARRERGRRRSGGGQS
jgi:hypothetical protein